MRPARCSSDRWRSDRLPQHPTPDPPAPHELGIEQKVDPGIARALERDLGISRSRRRGAADLPGSGGRHRGRPRAAARRVLRGRVGRSHEERAVRRRRRRRAPLPRSRRRARRRSSSTTRWPSCRAGRRRSTRRPRARPTRSPAGTWTSPPTPSSSRCVPAARPRPRLWSSVRACRPGRCRSRPRDEAPQTFIDIVGGNAYYIGSGSRCSVGFAVTGGFVTAGHCGRSGATTTSPSGTFARVELPRQRLRVGPRRLGQHAGRRGEPLRRHPGHRRRVDRRGGRGLGLPVRVDDRLALRHDPVPRRERHLLAGHGQRADPHERVRRAR